MNAIKAFPSRDALLVAQVADFKAKLQRDLQAYQQLLLLNMDMVQALAQHKEHYKMVQQWVTLARELI